MDERTAARRLAIARLALGASLMLAPGLAARPWIGGQAGRGATKVVTRGLGARDMALAMGALRAIEANRPTRGWVQAGVAADVADFAATLAAGRALPPAGRLATLGLAGTGVVAGLRLARSLAA